MQRTMFSATCAVIALVPGAGALAAQCGMPTDAPARRAELRVSAAQLASRLDDRGVVVLHVSMGRERYERGHIPGARWVDAHAFIDNRDGLTWEVPSASRIDSLLEGAGVSDGDRVVLYGDVHHLGRVFLALEVAGLYGRVSVFDGGMDAWREGGRAVATGPAPAARRGSFTPRPRTDLVVDADWVEARLDGRRATLLDVRSAGEYAGTARERLPRRGHIPGARLLEWTRSFAAGRATADGDGDPGGGRLADEGTLGALFSNAGAEAGRPLVVYCTIGMRAAHMYWVARWLGYDARLYDGSMEDWVRRFTRPVTQGDRP